MKDFVPASALRATAWQPSRGGLPAVARLSVAGGRRLVLGA